MTPPPLHVFWEPPAEDLSFVACHFQIEGNENPFLLYFILDRMTFWDPIQHWIY